MSRANGAGPVAGLGNGPIVVTGGAGFVGTNACDHFARRGHRVRIVDDLSREGVEDNLAWLRSEHGDRIEHLEESLVTHGAAGRAVADAAAVLHFAAQVAVTTSLADPRHDFDVNVRGTFGLLEALRTQGREIPLVFTSTNKVYGNLADVELVEGTTRYRPADETLRDGVDESRPLDFHSPYGCSKGAADQYVLDYARMFGLPATVFRMSCIYGPHQHGTEDQGWVAHFLLRALEGRPITIFGDGKQVRDVLWVEDLVRAFDLALSHRSRVSGRAFNIGGGRDNAVSLREVLARIEEAGSEPDVVHDDWRPGDQRWYVSDSAAFHEATGWAPRTGVKEGIGRLHGWLAEHRARPAARPGAERAAAVG